MLGKEPVRQEIHIGGRRQFPSRAPKPKPPFMGALDPRNVMGMVGQKLYAKVLGTWIRSEPKVRPNFVVEARRMKTSDGETVRVSLAAMTQDMAVVHGAVKVACEVLTRRQSLAPMIPELGEFVLCEPIHVLWLTLVSTARQPRAEVINCPRFRQPGFLGLFDGKSLLELECPTLSQCRY